jgi:hypothetical protein
LVLSALVVFVAVVADAVAAVGCSGDGSFCLGWDFRLELPLVATAVAVLSIPTAAVFAVFVVAAVAFFEALVFFLVEAVIWGVSVVEGLPKKLFMDVWLDFLRFLLLLLVALVLAVLGLAFLAAGTLALRSDEGVILRFKALLAVLVAMLLVELELFAITCTLSSSISASGAVAFAATAASCAMDISAASPGSSGTSTVSSDGIVMLCVL